MNKKETNKVVILSDISGCKLSDSNVYSINNGKTVCSKNELLTNYFDKVTNPRQVKDAVAHLSAKYVDKYGGNANDYVFTYEPIYKAKNEDVYYCQDEIDEEFQVNAQHYIEKSQKESKKKSKKDGLLLLDAKKTFEVEYFGALPATDADGNELTVSECKKLAQDYKLYNMFYGYDKDEHGQPIFHFGGPISRVKALAEYLGWDWDDIKDFDMQEYISPTGEYDTDRTEEGYKKKVKSFDEAIKWLYTSAVQRSKRPQTIYMTLSEFKPFFETRVWSQVFPERDINDICDIINRTDSMKKNDQYFNDLGIVQNKINEEINKRCVELGIQNADTPNVDLVIPDYENSGFSRQWEKKVQEMEAAENKK